MNFKTRVNLSVFACRAVRQLVDYIKEGILGLKNFCFFADYHQRLYRRYTLTTAI